MTREEMIRSFANTSARCKLQCPYSKTCHHGDFCIFKEVALMLSADKTRLAEMEEQVRIMKELCYVQLGYARYMEQRCFDYYDMIHAYNGGVEKKLWIPPRRRMAAERRRKTKAAKAAEAKRVRDKTKLDGDPQYAQNITPPREEAEEVIV